MLSPLSLFPTGISAAASMSIRAGTQRWTVSHRDRRGSCEQLGTLVGWLESAASPEAPVERVEKVQLRSGFSGRESEQEQRSREGAEGGAVPVEPFPQQGPRGSGTRGGDPRGARGHSALCRHDTGGATGAVPGGRGDTRPDPAQSQGCASLDSRTADILLPKQSTNNRVNA